MGKNGEIRDTQTGWVAQEVNLIYPQMVQYSDFDDLYTLSPTSLIPLLHRGWQLHEEKIETHEERISRLEKENQDLKDEIEKLRNAA